MTVTHLWFDNLIRVADNSDNQVASAAYKLSPGVNFINILRTAFMLIDPKSVKIQLNHKYIFTLPGSASVKE